MERSQDKPQKIEQQEQPAKKCFEIHKLEERIAPKNCHFNPQGKWVGCKRSYYYDPCYYDTSCW